MESVEKLESMTDIDLLGLLSARKGEVGQALDGRFKGTSGGQNSTKTTEHKKNDQQ